METEISKSYIRIVSLGIQHANRYRLAALSTDGINENSIKEVGRELVDLLEARIGALNCKTPTRETRAPKGSTGGRSTRQRGQN